MHKRLFISVSVAALCACANTSSTIGSTSAGTSAAEPIRIGEGLYKMGGLGSATELSGTAVKIRFMQQATAFCAGKGQAMAPGKSTTKDAIAGARASAEIQFRCVPK